MRKLIVIALVLGLLLGLAGCKPVVFDVVSYEESLRNYGEDYTKYNEAMQPLLNHKGELPDHAVLAYMRYLYPACYAYGQFSPDYGRIAQKLRNRVSPGMARWLALMTPTIREFERDCAFYLHTAKDWNDFETKFPELTTLLVETKYSFSTHPEFDYPLSEGQSERHVDTFLRRDGAMPPLAEEDVQRLWADHEEVCGEFLNDQANKKYPFYEAVRADYQNRYDINS